MVLGIKFANLDTSNEIHLTQNLISLVALLTCFLFIVSSNEQMDFAWHKLN